MKILNPLIKLITWRLAGNESKEWPSVSLPLLFDCQQSPYFSFFTPASPLPFYLIVFSNPLVCPLLFYEYKLCQDSYSRKRTHTHTSKQMKQTHIRTSKQTKDIHTNRQTKQTHTHTSKQTKRTHKYFPSVNKQTNTDKHLPPIMQTNKQANKLNSFHLLA